MGTSRVIISSFFGFLLMFNFVDLAACLDSCQDLPCGDHIPIHFPFRIKGRQPQHCGYPGFDLVCSASNETLLELPESVKLNVKSIDYKGQTIDLSDQNGCVSRQLHNLNLSTSRFELKAQSYDDYTIMNCTTADRHSDLVDMISCLSSPTYQVYAIPSSIRIEYLPLSFCSKIFNISSIPLDFLTEDNILRLRWSQPNCLHCELKGKRCGWKNSSASHETDCFGPAKGSSTALVTTGQFPKLVSFIWYFNARKLNASKIVVIINAGSVLGLLLVILVTFAIYRIYATYKLRKEKQGIIEKFLKDYRTLKPTRYSYFEIKRITNNFEDKLGQGAYGTVFRGRVSKAFPVAVKILNNSQGNGEEFINEVGTMGRIHHVNVVRLIGFCADGFRRALVYEFLPNGSLQMFIYSPDNRKNFLGWEKLQEIALGIAKGIEYLHQGCDQRILHFDIKPNNVLLDHNFSPKICDFGLAKLCSKEQSIVSMTTARGTMGYIAPEVFLRNFGNVSYKSDVYSYGMLLLEMIGGRKITEDTTENNSHVYYPEWIYNLLEERENMRIHIEDEGDAKIAKKLSIIGLWCIQWHAVDRPSMQVVVQMLEGEGDKLIIPPNPFASTDPKSKSTSVPGRHLVQNLEVIHELE